VGDILQKLNINAAPISATPISMAPPPDQAAQLQKILDFVGGLINPSDKSAPLGQVNGALGETIGSLLNGKKTAIGVIGSLLTDGSRVSQRYQRGPLRAAYWDSSS